MVEIPDHTTASQQCMHLAVGIIIGSLRSRLIVADALLEEARSPESGRIPNARLPLKNTERVSRD